ncbi:hypothetical protein [[Phormidium] sp. ETS-05]|uniref:hypothetical protein n=1 Tax=[Phormidium] sp. ETS-05 TaxID=222819 RepID=UPI0018EEF78A|nr:hypothetical protein [[Phormidium] sp. ETS-05]
MIRSKIQAIEISAVLPIIFFGFSLLTSAYLIFGVTNYSPPRKIVELFFSALSQANQAEAKKYLCFGESPVNRVSNWKLDQQKKSNSLASVKPDIDIEKVAAAFPDLKQNLYRLARFQHFQLVYHANGSTKSSSNARAKKWVFDVWEREKLLRYRELAKSILSEMYAKVENPDDGADLLKSITAAQYTGQFADSLANHLLAGNLDDLSSLPYCILAVEEVKSINEESNK